MDLVQMVTMKESIQAYVNELLTKWIDDVSALFLGLPSRVQFRDVKFYLSYEQCRLLGILRLDPGKEILRIAGQLLIETYHIPRVEFLEPKLIYEHFTEANAIFTLRIRFTKGV